MSSEQIRRLLLAPSTFEEASRFRSILKQVLYSGFRWGGLAGALGLLMYVGTEVLALGRPVAWLQGTGEAGQGVVIAEDLLLFALCGTAALLPHVRPTLTQGRALGAAGAIMGAGVFLRSDLTQGMMVEMEFIALLYLLVVVVVPFRPWQALAVGGGIGLDLYLSTELGWAIPEASVEGIRFSHHALEIGATLGLGLVISIVLYATRLAQYQVSQEATRALKKERDRFETLFDSVPTPIVHGRHEDAGLVVEDVNAAFEDTFGHREEELRGEVLSDRLAPESEQTGARPVALAAPDGHQRAEGRRATTDGSREFRIDYAVRQSENGVPEGYRIYTDITDRKRREEKIRRAKNEAEAARAKAEKAQKEAEEASRMKSAMLANMSHEIRTPLTSIIGFADTLEEEISSSEPLQEEGGARLNRFARLIGKSGRRLLETLDGVLNLSKLEAGQMELTAEKIDLSREAAAIVEELRPQAESAGVSCRLKTRDHAIPAWADQNGTQIVLRNLISNAIKYTEDGGEVCVQAYLEDEVAVLEVEDTGVGMDPGALDRLFRPFRQESEGRGREHEGTGIGLAVTQKVVGQMEGAIDVRTEKGEGTCFVVRLPKAEKEPLNNGHGNPSEREASEKEVEA